jgi:hypothetical protein
MKQQTTMLNANRNKIIRFPGVSLKQGDSFQKTLEDMEAPDTRRCIERNNVSFSGDSVDHEITYQNALDDFLREKELANQDYNPR